MKYILLLGNCFWGKLVRELTNDDEFFHNTSFFSHGILERNHDDSSISLVGANVIDAVFSNDLTWLEQGKYEYRGVGDFINFHFEDELYGGTFFRHARGHQICSEGFDEYIKSTMQFQTHLADVYIVALYKHDERLNEGLNRIYEIISRRHKPRLMVFTEQETKIDNEHIDIYNFPLKTCLMQPPFGRRQPREIYEILCSCFKHRFSRKFLRR